MALVENATCGYNIVGEREHGIDCGWNDGKNGAGGDRNGSGRDNGVVVMLLAVVMTFMV